jgi:Planctomycete cytochrome C
MNPSRRQPLRVGSVVLTVVVAAWGEAARAQSAESTRPNRAAEQFFHEQALPILRRHCFECHSHAAKKAKGGLVLETRSGWETGGDSGPAIVPGKPEESLLIRAVRHNELEMPPKGKLPPEAIAALETWVKMGAADPRVLKAQPSRTSSDRSDGRDHLPSLLAGRRPRTSS